MTDRQSELRVAEMTADHDTTPIPTDVLRAWVERVNTHLGPFEDVTVALHRAAVAALGPPRRPVTRETPLGTRITHESGTDRWLVGWKRNGWMAVESPDGYLGQCESPDGWYEVDGPEPEGAINYVGPDPSVECALPGCTNRLRKSDVDVPQFCSREHRAAYADPLPGTRVGEQMTEHTPVGAEVEREEVGRRKVTAHRDDGLGAWFDNGMWTSYETAGTVVALPEESER